MNTPSEERSRRLSLDEMTTVQTVQDEVILGDTAAPAKEMMLAKPPVLMSSASEMEDINRSLGYVPLSELNARKAPITPEEARQKPLDLSPSNAEDINRSLGHAPWDELEARTVEITLDQVRQPLPLSSSMNWDMARQIGLVPWEELKARKVPLPSYVTRSKDYYACVAVTRLSVHETLATHPKIEANHELRSELDHLTHRMAEQLEGTPVDQRKAMVDTVVAEWVDSLTPERFNSTDPLQPERDARETIRQSVAAAFKAHPQLSEKNGDPSDLGLDLGDIAYDMVDALVGLPARERRTLVDAAIAAWLEALPVENSKRLETIAAHPVFSETPEFPEFLTPSPSEVEINCSLGIVPLSELKSRKVDT